MDLPSVDDICQAVERALRDRPALDHVTFSGNGEPTLHPEFPEMVEAVRRVKDHLAPAARLAILSNSSTLGDARVREALTPLDVRIMKLDVGNEAALSRFNRPMPGITLASIVDALAGLPAVTLQALFARGPGGNLGVGDVADWVDQVVRIRPVAVQVYTLARGYPARDIAPASPEDLQGIRATLSARGVP